MASFSCNPMLWELFTVLTRKKTGLGGVRFNQGYLPKVTHGTDPQSNPQFTRPVCVTKAFKGLGSVESVTRTAKPYHKSPLSICLHIPILLLYKCSCGRGGGKYSNKLHESLACLPNSIKQTQSHAIFFLKRAESLCLVG